MSKGFPDVPLPLLELLEVRYPDRMPDTAALTHIDIARMNGAVDVVRLLRRHFNQQTKTILEKK